MQTVNPALEAEYNNRVLVPDHPAIFERWRRDSASFRDSTPCTLDIAYRKLGRGGLFSTIHPTEITKRLPVARTALSSNFNVGQWLGSPSRDAAAHDVSITRASCTRFLWLRAGAMRLPWREKHRKAVCGKTACTV